MPKQLASLVRGSGFVLEVPAGYRPAYVVDASVVIKWFTQEQDSPLAMELLTDCLEGRRTLLAPAILYYEVANALRFNSLMDAGELEKAMDLLGDIPISLASFGAKALGLAARLARERNLTVYDAAYLYLAISEGIPLITADQLLLRQSGGGILTLGLRQLYYAKLSGNVDEAPYC